MGRLGRGGTLINVHIRTAVLSCVLAASLLSSSVNALSVEPVLDSVLSIAKLSETSSPAGSSRPNIEKSADKPPASASSSSRPPDTVMSPPVSGDIVPEPVMAARPIDQLPIIDSTKIQSQTMRIYRPAATLTGSHAVMDIATSDDVAPLQASRHGWQIFGITWYWWLASGLITYCVIRRMVAVRYRQKTNNHEMV